MSVKLVHEHILMRDGFKRLREGNRKQTRKREKSKKQIPNTDLAKVVGRVSTFDPKPAKKIK
ncbi:uncharacterized protein N7511_011299 [Penicillium nucicola]|uniref:uncharacterized protein n=1 Tax=Penicillium nucicola TaxID=1850975 RepID=UPI00254552C8|nr:uncharacterized protein N7511_011299 [Penicillium nucicola]KAJ5742567.1 hypothetical protein N7511_011299 [Penicillium nucicola]